MRAQASWTLQNLVWHLCRPVLRMPRVQLHITAAALLCSLPAMLASVFAELADLMQHLGMQVRLPSSVRACVVYRAGQKRIARDWLAIVNRQLQQRLAA